MTYDVLVLGAGLAGLAAAAELSCAGLDAVVVEARARVGGRVHTLHDPRTPLPIELGAELVHEGAAATRALVHEASLSLHELAGSYWVVRGGLLHEEKRFDARIAHAIRALGTRAKGRDLPFADALARARGIAPFDKQVTRAFVEGFHAADPQAIGM